MKTWKCPLCADSVQISYEWLAEHGNPVCPKCDCDMELAVAADDIERLAAKIVAAGLEPEDLDETVHELAAHIAAEVNNGEWEAQIGYLIEHLGTPGAETQLDQLIAEKTTPASDDS